MKIMGFFFLLVTIQVIGQEGENRYSLSFSTGLSQFDSNELTKFFNNLEADTKLEKSNVAFSSELMFSYSIIQNYKIFVGIEYIRNCLIGSYFEPITEPDHCSRRYNTSNSNKYIFNIVPIDIGFAYLGQLKKFDWDFGLSLSYYFVFANNVVDFNTAVGFRWDDHRFKSLEYSKSSRHIGIKLHLTSGYYIWDDTAILLKILFRETDLANSNRIAYLYNIDISGFTTRIGLKYNF